MTSSSAFSSPKRYSSGPATTPIERSPTRPARSISVTAARTRSRSAVKVAFSAMNTSRLERQRGDGQSLDDLIRVGPQDRAVFERARLAFRPVAHGVTVTTGRAPYRAPLRRDREAGATPTAQPGLLQLGDRRFGPELLRPGETLASSCREPLLERCDGFVGENDLGATHHARKLVLHPAGVSR